MKKQQGKMNITGLLILVVIFYGGYAAVKLITASMTETQIEKEVVERLAMYRDSDLTDEEAMKHIREVLGKHDVILDEKEDGAVDVQIDRKAGKIFYYYKYGIEVDLIFWTKKKTVEVDSEIRSYD
jgi:hypothetical protein